MYRSPRLTKGFTLRYLRANGFIQRYPKLVVGLLAAHPAGLARLDLRQMPRHGKPSSQPAQIHREQQQRNAVAERHRMQYELAGVELRQSIDLVVEQQQAEGDDEPGHDATEQSLGRAEIQERAADEAVGRADQFGDFDLAALRQDLQADGVESDRDQREAEQAGQNQCHDTAEFEQGFELVSPGRIELCLLHSCLLYTS